MEKLHLKITSIASALLLLGTLASCGAPSAEELAARDIGNNASMWDEEDYKSIAAKGCLAFKESFDLALGENYLDWVAQIRSFVLVRLTTGALDDHKKWGPIAEVVDKFYLNALSRGSGGSGVTIPSDLNTQSFELCKEVGVDMTA